MPEAAFGQDDELVAESFGAGDEIVGAFGQDDEIVTAGVDEQLERKADLFAAQKQAREQGEYWEGVANRADFLNRAIVEPLTRPLSGAFGKAADVIVPGPPIVEPTLQQAGIHLPRAGQAQTTAGQIAAGTYNAAADLLSALSSPDMIALLPAATSKPVLTAWISQMAGHAPERVLRANELFKEGKKQEAWQEVASTVAELGMAELGRRHVVRDPNAPTAADLRADEATVVDPRAAQDIALRLTDPRTARETELVRERFPEFQEQPPIVEPRPQSTDARFQLLREEGVKPNDAEALLNGTKTPNQVVQENLKTLHAPAFNADVSQGHAEAWIEGYNQAVQRLTDIIQSEQKQTAASPITPQRPQVTQATEANAKQLPLDRNLAARIAYDLINRGKPDEPLSSLRVGGESIAEKYNVPIGVVDDVRRIITDRLNQIDREGRNVNNKQAHLEAAKDIQDGFQDEALKKILIPVKEQTPPPLPTPTPEIVGMGGAIPAEFAPIGGSATSIKNAVVERERAARGLPSAIEPARRAFGEVWDRAMAVVDQDPGFQNALISELKQKPRALTDLEDALLLHRQVDLQNDYGKLTRELAQAFSDSEQFPSRLADVESLKLRVQDASNKLLELYEINKSSGTETGRGLNARKMLANEDFTLAQMEVQRRVDKDGAPLTDAERAEIKTVHDKLQRLQSEFDALTKRTEEAQARQRSEQMMTDLRQEAVKDPEYSPVVLKLAERIVSTLETRADAARIRLREKLARTSAGVDPTILADVVEIGAAHLARRTLDLAQFSARLIEEFGETIRPYVEPAFEKAQQAVVSAGERIAGKRSAEAIRKMRSGDETQQRNAIIENIANAAREERPLDEISSYVRNLALRLVKDGVTDRDALIDTIHNVLKDSFNPEITRRQTMDAISGYGDWKPLDPDAAKTTLRDLKGQMQQLAKLEDIEARKPLLKTGVERRPPSDTERRLIQQVNEAKRKYGVVVTDPATQLKSAQDAILTRLRHQIADLNVQIANQARTVKTNTAVTTTPEMEALRTERDRLRTQLDELVPRPGISDAQRSQMAERALESDIALYEQRIKSGDIRPLRGKQQGPPTERMDQLRTRRDELKAQLEELRAARDPKLTPEQRALKTLKRRMLTDLSKTQDRINRGDFEPRKRKEPPPLDAEAARIKGELDRTKTEWRQRSVEEARKRMTKLEKAWDLTKEATHAQRQFWTAFDVSAPGRQGAILTGSHPQLAVKAGGSMFKALSEKNADAEWAQIQARPNAQNGVYERAKLYLSNPHDTTLSKLEENVRSRWLRNVPGIKQSNQAYVTFLNRLRADAFDLLKNNLERKGQTLTQPELQGIANYINIATGRGDFGRLAGAAEGLAIPFFSPRLVLSRFQYIIGQPIYKAGSWRVRKMILQEYARSAATFGTLLTLGLLAGATVETDETSADFLKLKFGNTRLDIGGGLLQAIVAISRQVEGQRKSAAGKVTPLGTGFGQDSRFDEAVRFARTKFSPTHGAYWDFTTGENMIGEKVEADLATIATYLAAPLAWRDALDIMEEHGIPAGTAIQILSLFGVGVQHYKPRK